MSGDMNDPTIREVRDVVSGTQQHFSRAVRAGGLLFLSGNGFDGEGRPLAGSVPPPPYHLSEAAHCVYQTRAVFDAYRPLLAEFGCTFEDMVQIEQYIPHKIHGDSYVNTSRGPGYLERNRPTSALLVTGDLAPSGAVVAQSGIAAIPTDGQRKEIVRADREFTADTAKAEYGESWAVEPPFHEIEATGPYIFTVGDIALDWDKGEIPPGVKVQPFTYWGSEIRNETEFLLDRLQGFTERVGGSLQDITHITLYLTEVGDVFEMDRVWGRYFGDTPPTRTVVPGDTGLSPARGAGTDPCGGRRPIGAHHAGSAARPRRRARGRADALSPSGARVGGDPCGGLRMDLRAVRPG